MATELVKFAVETLKFIFFAILWHFVLFNLGRSVLLICTAGRYPRGRTLELHADRMSLVGVLVLFCAWSALALHNNFPAAFA
ncbi:MAG: hypothetical protein ABIQ70_07375 [Dokdonella sp.]